MKVFEIIGLLGKIMADALIWAMVAAVIITLLITSVNIEEWFAGAIGGCIGGFCVVKYKIFSKI